MGTGIYVSCGDVEFVHLDVARRVGGDEEGSGGLGPRGGHVNGPPITEKEIFELGLANSMFPFSAPAIVST